VTPAALEHFRRQLGSQAGKAVRLSVEKSGCTGFHVRDRTWFRAGRWTAICINQLDEQVELLIDRTAPWNVLSAHEIDLVKEGYQCQIRFQSIQVKDSVLRRNFSVS